MRILIVVLCVCGCKDAPDDAGQSQSGPTIAPNVTLDGPVLFELDTTQAVFKGVVHDSDESLTAELTDDAGRRAIIFGGTQVFPGDWNLPPVAAVAKDSSALVCSNLLTGGPSELTVGDQPDPRQGVSLRCRRRAVSGSWEDVSGLIKDDTAAWWLSDVSADGADFLIRVVRDADGVLLAAHRGEDGPHTIRVGPETVTGPTPDAAP